MTTILSINFNHDGAAFVLRDGVVAAQVTTERFSRLKKHPGVRLVDLDELLDQAGTGIEGIDHVMLCNLNNMDSPDVVTLHGSDLKHTWPEFWVDGRESAVLLAGRRIPATVNPDHHLAHAACAYYTSPATSAVSVAIDPTGCRAFIGCDHRLYPLRRDFDSWFTANIAYTYVAVELFGSGIVGAGKVMGFAPYGRPFPPGERMPTTLTELFTLAQRSPAPVSVGDRLLNATLAAYVQHGLEQQMIRLFDELDELRARNDVGPALCLSGGTALNAVATQLAFERSAFTHLHLHPACGDDGTALGAALWLWHHEWGHPRGPAPAASDLMYSVRTYGEDVVERALDEFAGQLHVERTEDHAGRAAELLAGGAVIGWFQGAAEIGPRALGNRSILADPRDPTVRDRLNSTVKFREHFRPYAPSVLDEHADEWFGLSDSPFMLRVASVRRPDLVPAVTHVDGTARIQTVRRGDNPAFYDLIAAFAARTGVPMVLNTSLNIKGEPIAETPADAIRVLLGSALDHVVLPGFVLTARSAA